MSSVRALVERRFRYACRVAGISTHYYMDRINHGDRSTWDVAQRRLIIWLVRGPGFGRFSHKEFSDVMGLTRSSSIQQLRHCPIWPDINNPLSAEAVGRMLALDPSDLRALTPEQEAVAIAAASAPAREDFAVEWAASVSPSFLRRLQGSRNAERFLDRGLLV